MEVKFEEKMKGRLFKKKIKGITKVKCDVKIKDGNY